MELCCTFSNNEESSEVSIFTMNSIVFLDIAVITILIVLAYLSKRLGEALKTPPLYRLFYAGVVVLVFATMQSGYSTLAFPFSLIINPVALSSASEGE